MSRVFHDIKIILLDIEGTICPITFVKDTLFPYAIAALPEVLETRWDDPPFQPYREAFPTEFRITPSTFQAHVEDLTKRDVKIAYLKNLQGYLWQAGYESQAYATPLYPDVVPELQKWQATSKDIVIYSSGSVFAQKLLFAHVKTDTASDPDPRQVTETEDLQSMIRDWFDTTNAGLKHDASSYESIAKALGTAPGQVLFLSDNVKEVGAAIRAGMKSVVVDRPGNAPLSGEDSQRYEVVTSFDQLDV